MHDTHLPSISRDELLFRIDELQMLLDDLAAHPESFEHDDCQFILDVKARLKELKQALRDQIHNNRTITP